MSHRGDVSAILESVAEEVVAILDLLKQRSQLCRLMDDRLITIKLRPQGHVGKPECW